MTLEELEPLCNSASPGPWDYSFTRSGIEITLTEANAQETIDNIRFITAARSAMPKLIAIAKAAKAFYTSEKTLNMNVHQLEEHQFAAWINLLDALTALEKENAK